MSADDFKEARDALRPLVKLGLAEIFLDADGVEVVRLTDAGRKHAEAKWPEIKQEDE